MADANPDVGVVLARHGLLGLCRALGVDRAYALLEAAHQPPEPVADGHALARLRAGSRPDSGDAQLQHAIAALSEARTHEAQRAIVRCRETSPSWERKAHATALARAERTQPQLAAAIGELRALLLDSAAAG